MNFAGVAASLAHGQHDDPIPAAGDLVTDSWSHPCVREDKQRERNSVGPQHKQPPGRAFVPIRPSRWPTNRKGHCESREGHNSSMIAIDFGTGTALALHGDYGPVRAPKPLPVKGGKAMSDSFIHALKWALFRDDVVVESPTVRSSGVEVDEVADIVAHRPRKLYMVSARAVQNYKKDNSIPLNKDSTSHKLDAQIIHIIATESPERLRLWRPLEPRKRIHKSVRPHDKRKYRGPKCDQWMARWPEFRTLPTHLQRVFGTVRDEYSRSLAMPFAMAFDEKGFQPYTRAGYERAIGLYEHGYPSFYRRNVNRVMREVARDYWQVKTFDELTRDQRKIAWQLTRRYIREVWHLMIENTDQGQGTVDPEKGTTYPGPQNPRALPGYHTSESNVVAAQQERK